MPATEGNAVLRYHLAGRLLLRLPPPKNPPRTGYKKIEGPLVCGPDIHYNLEAHMKIKVLRLGHSANVIEVPAGTSVEEALDGNHIPRQGYSISVNGLGAGPSTTLGDEDVVTLVPKVEGGRR